MSFCRLFLLSNVAHCHLHLMSPVVSCRMWCVVTRGCCHQCLLSPVVVIICVAVTYLTTPQVHCVTCSLSYLYLFQWLYLYWLSWPPVVLASHARLAEHSRLIPPHNLLINNLLVDKSNLGAVASEMRLISDRAGVELFPTQCCHVIKKTSDKRDGRSGDDPCQK